MTLIWPCLSQLIALLLLWPSHSSAHFDSKSGNVQARSTSTTCDAITINYITHSLPQSCLTSTWASSGQSHTEYLPDTPRNVPGDDPASSIPPTELVTSTTASDPTPEPQEVSGDGAAKPFMSFEDWKEKMLRETGQDPKDIRSRNMNHRRSDDRIPLDMGHAGLGEEDEISLNFDSYLDNNKPADQRDHTAGSSPSSSGEHGVGDPVAYDDDGRPSIHRSKDAGKTCKERFSYSSFDGGATVLKWSPGAQNYKAILVENKDSYMLLECSARQKFVIVELSDDILIDTVVLANFEFFSSMIRHFKLSVSDHYPVKTDRWRDLGTFEARNSRDIQPFLVENPQIWAKYVRIEFLTHYGNEYYCPVSLLRVHGSRLLDSWKDGEANRDEEPPLEYDQEHPQFHIQVERNVETQPRALDHETSSEVLPVEEALSCSVMAASQIFSQAAYVCMAPLNQTAGDAFRHSDANASKSRGPGGHVPPRGSIEGRGTTRVPVTRTGPIPAEEAPTAPPSITPPTPSSVVEPTNSSLEPISSAMDSTTDPTGQVGSSKTASNSEPNHPVAPVGKISPQVSPSGKNRTSGSTGSSVTSPPVQEGFFKAITKRLQQVESNLTLSLKYVEDQARHLQDSLQRTEQKQISKANLFLDHLNRTVLSEMRNVRDQYDQIWQSTVIALESQREQSQREIVALSTRLNLLADEVVFQKRMAIVQAVLLLSCLVLVIFSRGVSLPYLAPFVDQGNSSPYESTVSPRVYARARGLYGPAYDSTREEVTTYRMHTGIDFIPGTSPTGDPEPGSASRLRAEHSPEDEAALLQQERLSPPPTPTLVDGLLVAELPPQPRESQSTVLRHPTSKQQGNVRKPLPALPENPSSP